ncbi:MAG: metallophosphoesterase family protein [Polyangiaceae bacterium]|nr:metallophosphoesterase family protein [Polyangiaceae bacterium]
MSHDPKSHDPKIEHPSGQSEEAQPAAVSRRFFLTGAGVASVAAAASPLSVERQARAATPDGTPEQIHLTFGADPASEVVVSWASPAQAVNPRVHVGESHGRGRTVHAVQRTYTDGLNGQTVFTYHARLDGLRADTLHYYVVTADNDSNAAQPFAASFRTAPRGRAAFRWTSYGDLATPNTAWVLSSAQAKFAVPAVERFAPLFHLLNGDLCYADLNPTAQPATWTDYGNNVQPSAAFRPWMPCPGNHEIEFNNGPQGFTSYLTRFALPDNGTAFPGRWYSFRVGTALFISLSADDVIYQDGGPFVSGPSALTPAASTGNPPIEAGTSLYINGYSGGAQTRWLEKTLREAREDESIDWIIVQMHQDALSSSKTGNGSDLGLREAWLPLFEQHGVDLVLCGHDHDYERSYPVHGFNRNAGFDAATGSTVDTRQPKPVVTAPKADGTYDTTHGTIHLILGGGGTSAPLDVYGVDANNGLPQAKVITKPNRPAPGSTAGTFVRAPADAVEDAIWSAQRDPSTGYGIAVFDLDPDAPNGKTTITIQYFHAPGADSTPNPNYELFETVVLAKDRRRG